VGAITRWLMQGECCYQVGAAARWVLLQGGCCCMYIQIKLLIILISIY